MSRARLLITQHSSLITLGLASLLLYWLLWVPAYRLNERFEYVDLLFRAFPWIADVLAAQLGAARTILPATVGSYQATAILFGALLVALFGLYGLALVAVRHVPR